MTIEELRTLFLAAPESTATRTVSICLAAIVLLTTLWLVRARRLRLEFTPIWMIGALGLAVLSVRFDILRMLTRLIGAWTPSAAIFFLSVSFLGLVSLTYAVRLSKLVIDVKNLSQEIALLRAELERSRREPARDRTSAADRCD